MNNIEKYSETKDALDAYEEYRDCGGVLPLSQWLECEYEEPNVKTLLEAAEALKKTWYKEFPHGKITSIIADMGELADAIEREKRKPFRNFNKYETAKDAFVGFNKMCSDKYCDRCPFSAERNECPICKLNWLYSEAEK